VLLLGALLAGGALVLLDRARTAVLLGLERQRTAIAMDLHDELGAGLGSIGILAGVASNPRVADTERQDFAQRIHPRRASWAVSSRTSWAPCVPAG
jgi:signal transduction histidine kinase